MAPDKPNDKGLEIPSFGEVYGEDIEPEGFYAGIKKPKEDFKLDKIDSLKPPDEQEIAEYSPHRKTTPDE